MWQNYDVTKTTTHPLPHQLELFQSFGDLGDVLFDVHRVPVDDGQPDRYLFLHAAHQRFEQGGDQKRAERLDGVFEFRQHQFQGFLCNKFLEKF